jgi:hypothetical protein
MWTFVRKVVLKSFYFYFLGEVKIRGVAKLAQ